jgi:hypothetical protein
MLCVRLALSGYSSDGAGVVDGVGFVGMGRKNVGGAARVGTQVRSAGADMEEVRSLRAWFRRGEADFDVSQRDSTMCATIDVEVAIERFDVWRSLWCGDLSCGESQLSAGPMVRKRIMFTHGSAIGVRELAESAREGAVFGF